LNHLQFHKTIFYFEIILKSVSNQEQETLLHLLRAIFTNKLLNKSSISAFPEANKVFRESHKVFLNSHYQFPEPLIVFLNMRNVFPEAINVHPESIKVFMNILSVFPEAH
jgi:hypothetical protein